VSSKLTHAAGEHARARRVGHTARGGAHDLGAPEAGAFRTLPWFVLIEMAYGLLFCVLLFRAFVATISREVDEAANIDGAGPVWLFFQVVFSLLRSIVVSVAIVQSASVFNDFHFCCTSCPATTTRPCR
jgi:ABC-type glycerol-3-phosphate transport system permease component